jgi:hypothetical protein
MPAHNPVMQDPATGDFVKYAVPDAWGSSPLHDLKLPSGSTIQVKRIDMPAIVAADMVDEFDKLSSLAEDNVVKPSQGKRPADRQPRKLTKAEREAAERKAEREFLSSGNMETLLVLMGRIIPQVVIQPKVSRLLCQGERQVGADPVRRARYGIGLSRFDSARRPDGHSCVRHGGHGRRHGRTVELSPAVRRNCGTHGT